LLALATPTTRDRLEAEEQKILPDAAIEAEGQGSWLDLGERRVRLVPRLGHTSSDVTVELEEPRVVWCGDLVWNGMFPNYVDAVPSHLTRHCEAILGREGTHYVPGHGDTGGTAALASYLDLVLDIEEAARKAVEAGVPAVDAAAAYRLPDGLAEWVMFSPDYVERAFLAWQRELAG
jgi:glyoxylase-like metal-dependent hydrolase (beta-lactamase superfamily II)